jgi:hypothetical protein
MGLFWLVAYCVLVGLAVAQAVLMVLQTWEHRRFARSRFRALRRARPSGKAMVFAPCKGIDDDLEENLRRLFHQDYGDYEITFIVEDVSDPAYGRIRRLIADHRHVVCHLVIAGRAKESGQKVHNLRMATRQLRSEIEFLAFIDSDARPRREWLRGLIGRLADRGNRDVGAVTGYRWLVPTRPTPANHLLYGVNCGITALFGPKGFYPIWGGSWAIRRTVFKSIGLRQEWKGTLSDDLVASNVLRRNKLGVRFEPAGVVTSPIDGGLRQMFSFLRRQYLIGRFYTPRAWALGLASAALPNLAWWISLGAVIQGLAAGASVWLPAGACAALYLVNVARGWMRQDLIGLYCPDLRAELRRARRFDVVAWPLVSLANAVGMFASMLGRHITWRGITYRLSTGGRIRITRRDVATPDAEPSPAYRRAA